MTTQRKIVHAFRFSHLRENHTPSRNASRKAEAGKQMHSTGPRTLEGKQISSQNALRHGCCSKNLVLPGEDPAAWESLKSSWLTEYDTSSPVFLSLALQAAEKQWLLVRAQKRFDEAQQALYAAQPDCRLWDEEHCKLHDRFQRYLTTAERAFDRAFHNAERLRRVAFKEHDVAFKEDLELRRFALKTEKTGFEITLLRAKTEHCQTKTAKLIPQAVSASAQGS